MLDGLLISEDRSLRRWRWSIIGLISPFKIKSPLSPWNRLFATTPIETWKPPLSFRCRAGERHKLLCGSTAKSKTVNCSTPSGPRKSTRVLSGARKTPVCWSDIGNNLMRLKVFPVLPKHDQKVKISFTVIANQDNGVVEYVYPLKTDGKGTKDSRRVFDQSGLEVATSHPEYLQPHPCHYDFPQRRQRSDDDV